jgi:hypothetical protein
MIKFSSPLYNVLKSIAQVWLPAIGTLYFALSGIWGFHDATQVVGSITAFDTFLGVVLAVSSATYSAPTDGKLVADTSSPLKDVYSLELNAPVSALAGKSSITLDVIPPGKS